MKGRLLAICLLWVIGMTDLQAIENQPDTLYLFSYATGKNKNRNGLHFAWSVDGRRWTRIGNEYSFLKSDYGTWGSEKRMLDPVIERTPAGRWLCSWLVNERDKVLACTESDDLILWKPQDYYPEKMKMGPNRNIGRQTVVFPNGEEAQGQIHRVERSVVHLLVSEYERKQYRQSLHDELAKDDPIRFADLKPVSLTLTARPEDTKSISPDLFGIFFEDINYAADGGLYGELLQNRDFEYSMSDKKGHDKNWNSLHSWSVKGKGLNLSVNTSYPLHENNPHYAVLSVAAKGGSLINAGWDGVSVKAGEKYDFTLYGRQQGEKGMELEVRLCDKEGKTLASQRVRVNSKVWRQSKAVLCPSATVSDGYLELVPQSTGSIAIDMVSLFPQETFKKRKNGMRKDLAEALADLKPQFVRFPGGCVAHGDGIHNIYRWKNTIGNPEARKPQRNLWGYHQSMGIGYYEYFQFCEDIGAQPLPVLAAGVPCQNSSDRGAGQQGGIPLEQMDEYVQDVLDLIEWANGDKRTKWGKLRAEAGHPEPFHLKYIGIGNEDLISEVFKERFTLIYNAVREKHPEITVIGTVGPFYEGSDYEYGWKLANELQIPVVDEHYYCPPGWFIYNQDYYDRYDRSKSKVYLGEYASHVPGRVNNIESALSCALYLTSVERNADVVKFSSYAPLLARRGHTQWRPDMIYFDNKGVYLTTDYYVQRMFGCNAGGEYIPCEVRTDNGLEAVNARISSSVVRDLRNGDLIVKLVNMLPVTVKTTLNLTGLLSNTHQGTMEVLQGSPDDRKAVPMQNKIEISPEMEVELLPYSFAVIRIDMTK